MPTVIAKSRTVNLGAAGAATKATFAVDMVTQSQADVRSMVRGISGDVTAEQLRLGNPPSLVEVDGRSNRRVADVDKKIVVVFGTMLASAAMAIVSAALREAILATTVSRSGRLADVSGSWRWLFLSGGRVTPVTGANQILSFGINDRLMLVPANVPHATVANRAVAGGGGLSIKTRKGKASKRNQNLGFLAYAARMLKRRTEFRQFSIYVAFTQRHKVPGELSKVQGTGMIVIRPRRRTERA